MPMLVTNWLQVLDKCLCICYAGIVGSDKHLVAVLDSENGLSCSNWQSVSSGENEEYLLFFITRCFIMRIIYFPKDRRFVSSTLVRTVPIVFLSRNSGRLLRLYVNVYRYPCGRLWFHVPCSSFCFAPRINGFGDVSFQSVSEMLPYTCLPTELLYSRLGIRPYRCK